jgi:DNA-binding cell septation regulator SpoVG
MKNDMKIDIQKIEVKFQFKNNENLMAQVTMTLGQFELRGFRIMKTKFKDNKSRFVLFPPAVPCGGGKFMHIVRIVDKKYWEELQDFVLAKFDQEHTEFLMASMQGDSPGIDVSKINY